MGRPTTMDDGDAELLIPEQDAGESHIISVTGDNPVRIGHSKVEARYGVELTPGQRQRISQLRGDEIYGVAVGGPSEVRISRAAANVEPFAERNVAVVEGDLTANVDSVDVEDRVGRELGKVRVQDSGGVLVDPATDTTLTNTLPRTVDQWQVADPIDVSVSNEPVDVNTTTAAITTVETGRVTVTTAGTAEQLPAVTVDGELTITALPDNTGLLYVGDSTVDAATGDVLQAGQSYTTSIDNANGLYIDADNDGDGLTFVAEQA